MMNWLVELFTNNKELLNFLAMAVTAFATVALVYATLVLAKLTRAMAEVASSPNVVVSIQPSLWSPIHLNQHILNSGTAPAFDVTIEMRLTDKSETSEQALQYVWKRVDLLVPRQEVRAFAGSLASIQPGKIDINVSWARNPGSRKRISLKYIIDTSDWSGKAAEVGGDPLVELAKATKNLRDDWKVIASGSARLSVDSYSKEERAVEKSELEEKIRRITQASEERSE